MEIENLTFKTEKEYKEFLDYLFSGLFVSDCV